MKTITLNMQHMQTKQLLHAYLARDLDFPNYYGENLDALYDCLTDIDKETLVEMPLEVTSESVGLGSYGVLLCKVFEQAAKENDHLQFRIVI